MNITMFGRGTFGAAAVMRPGDVIESNSIFHRAGVDETIGLSQLIEKLTADAVATGKWIRNPNGSVNWILPAPGSGEAARNVNQEATERRAKLADSLPMVTDVIVRHTDGTTDRYTLTEDEFKAFKSSGVLDTKQNATKTLETAVKWSVQTAPVEPQKKQPILMYAALAALATYLSVKH